MKNTCSAKKKKKLLFLGLLRRSMVQAYVKFVVAKGGL